MAGFSDSFDSLNPADWHVANYRFTHPAFDTDWTPDNLRVDTGVHLALTPQTGAENRFLGSSLRRTHPSHYGRYEALLRPAKADGVVTGFFTYTGAHYGSRHDEIDIEFLGNDTTRMQVAWFVDGQLESHSVPLGFDAADRPRRYAFEWHPDRLRWFVEDQLVFEITQQSAALPKEPGYLFANLWAVDNSLASWAGTAADGTTASAYVGQVQFTPLQQATAALKP